MGDGPADPWEQHAAWWQAEFTDGADPEYEEQILPIAERLLAGFPRVLDVGCGEGQVARRVWGAAAAGAVSVVGVEPSWSQLAAGADRGGGVVYAQGVARSLGVRSASCDAVVACLVFEHITDMEEAVGEVARVLRPEGRFVLLLNHPLLQAPDSGWIDDHMVDPPEQYWRVGSYLEETAVVEEVEKDVFIPFIHRPLSRYVNAMAAVGLGLRAMEEPPPPPGFLARAPEYREAATIPRLLVLVSEKRG